ncbi:bub1p [Saccharomyces arboricola H-6]|uniref:Bub1p n=1 Tax=Saccharomyces arboricola (strain H-6 / AS 2.3317 / CBS 10644) TaxID=1160507 RepID=J8LN91_SACAR|nr:bub1p [Saccharomyces arboricola H-6]
MNLDLDSTVRGYESDKDTLSQPKDDTSSQKKHGILNHTKIAYEERLLNELEDMDDPLDLFLDYMIWISTSYIELDSTSGQELLRNTMERCLVYIQDLESYKNDPRFSKVWIWYINLFLSSNFRECENTFTYMFKKGIGIKLSLFYEEFSKLLENAQYFLEAKVLLELGAENNCRPYNRLLRSLSNYEDRLREMNILENQHSTSDSKERLEARISYGSVPFFMRKYPTSSSMADDKENRVEPELNSNIEVYKHTPSIYQDPVLATDPKIGLENHSHHNSANKPSENGNKKIPIFADSKQSSGPVYKLINTPGRKLEKIAVNFGLIYPRDDEEINIEELLAISRGFYERQRRSEKHAMIDANNYNSDINSKKQKLDVLVEKRQQLPPSQPPIIPKSTQIEIFRDETNSSQSKQQSNRQVQVQTTTSILPLKPVVDGSLAHETPIKSFLNTHNSRSPTVTAFSKDAMNEVFSMFNQHYSTPGALLDGDDTTTSKFNVFENFTQEFTAKNTEDLTEIKNSKEEVTPQQPSSNNEINGSGEKLPVNTTSPERGEYMTPIKETTETSVAPPNQASAEQIDTEFRNSRDTTETQPELTNTTVQSSPFLTQPELQEKMLLKTENRSKSNIKYHPTSIPPIGMKKEYPPIIENPLSNTLRAKFLSEISPPLSQYSTFYSYNQELKMSSLLKKIHRVSRNENKNPIVDFKKTGDLYCIRGQLGEGGYATVYLAESSQGQLRALKVEKPASVWEYYIMSQVEFRLRKSSVLKSVINASALHLFLDESYLVLNYASQGTVLDLINLQREKTFDGNGIMDEYLCMFITVELMKVLEKIHEVGIIHGDLKPDNCMVRFERRGEPLGAHYVRNGKNGWGNKGIYLIDFGRSFDMTLLPPGTKFKANWQADQQDCWEMRAGKPWSYEADYYGLAGVIHSMLFGKFIETIQLQNGTWKLKTPLKRYWKKEVWTVIFDLLLNSGQVSNQALPMTQKVVEIRNMIETHLEHLAKDHLRNVILNVEDELSHLQYKGKSSRGF